MEQVFIQGRCKEEPSATEKIDVALRYLEEAALIRARNRALALLHGADTAAFGSRVSSEPPECGNERCQDLFPKFLYIVVMPAAITVTLIIILLIIICTRKRKSSVSPESDEKLAAYEAVRHASTNLRRMSHTNNTPLLASRSGSISVVRDQHRREARLRDSCHSAPGTLQRHPRNRDSSDWRNTPPPPPVYGMHPEYQLGDDDAFLGPEIPLQDFHVPELRQDGHHHQRHYSASNGYTTR